MGHKEARYDVIMGNTGTRYDVFMGHTEASQNVIMDNKEARYDVTVRTKHVDGGYAWVILACSFLLQVSAIKDNNCLIII